MTVSLWAGVWVRTRLHTDTTRRGGLAGRPSQSCGSRTSGASDRKSERQQFESSTRRKQQGRISQILRKKRQALKRVPINIEQKMAEAKKPSLCSVLAPLLRRFLLNGGKKRISGQISENKTVAGCASGIFSLRPCRWRRIKANRVRSHGVVHRVQDEEANSGWMESAGE